ncbi:DUF732 domain-containing protein [Mycolicibacterium sp.]|uniref:DUF732 domain-containing protein n=1 Tax=Mycolicibacterium sp. TaxID=2320850 RepID=UPI001A318F0D|nr:DUF732 domain-containing protein [Mycolicibacterium sp.]MBJ7340679.1 DUF732 domain-containing protein [Mycolicibacterium sp.]
MTVITGLIDVSAKATSAIAISVGIVVAASAAPATARADAASDTFLAALTKSGVSVADPNMAVTMAQSICPLLVQPGGNFASIASQMGGTNGVSPGMANLFTSIAISMYCPSMMASLANGNWLGQGAQMGLPGLSGLSGLGIPGI